MVKAKIKSTKKSAKKAVKKGKGSNSTNCHFGKANPYNYSETLAARKQKSQKTKAKGYGKKKKAISYQNYSNTTRHRKKPLKPKLSANFPRNSFVMDENTPWFKTSMGGMKSSNVSNRRQSPCYFEEIDLTKLQQLSEELVKFHGYCTLREVEVNARRYIMSSIEKLCQEQWGSEAKVENYGSFAVGKICTFSSDVDLALWGVVPTEDEALHQHCIIPLDPWEAAVDECSVDDISTFTMDADDGSLNLTKDNHEKPIDLTISDESLHAGNRPLFFMDNKPMGQTTDDAIVVGSGLSLNNQPQVIDLVDCEDESKLEEIENDHVEMMAFGMPEEVNWQALNDDDSDYNEDMKVSFVSRKYSAKSSGGLSNKMRLKVNATIKKIFKKCRKLRPFTQVTHIKNARVPIMQSKTVFNFECDLSIGGHNGSDTSNLSRYYTSTYSSFSLVTVFLKILLRQADLDKPFTGGLGSYRLYVMIAFHIEQHLRDGGTDNPTELLLGFLHRYGRRKTDVIDRPFVSCQQGDADLSGVYRIELCVELFNLTYEKLRSCLVTKNIEGRKEKMSILAQIVDSARLHKEREGFIAKAKLIRFYDTKGGNSQASSKKDSRKAVKSNEKKRKASKKILEEEEDDADVEADRLIRGYKLRRGPGGSLIPLQRPDLQHNKRRSSDEVLRGRASKMRKNKKKQNRDKNLRFLATFGK